MNELTDDALERIDKYLTRELNTAETEEVLSLIKNDPQWAHAYHLRLAAREAAGRHFKSELRRKFQSIDSEGSPKVRRIRPLWLAVAAGIAALISALLWLVPDQNSTSLMASYQKFPNVVSPIVKSADSLTSRDKAYQYYEAGSYTQAIQEFQAIDSVTTAERLYLGLSYLEMNAYSDAAPLLDEVRASSNPRWSQVADWYAAWLLIRQDRLPGARTIVRQISGTDGHRYQADAIELLKKL